MIDNLGTLRKPVPPSRDGRRYEVVDGRLLVTGVQGPLHHAAVVGLMVKLKAACPPDYLIAVGSLDFRPTRGLSLRPDLLVCRSADAGPQYVEHPLLLAVEVLSPSTHTTDVVLKRALYEQSGVQSYWLLDPHNQELTILELTNSHYTCQAVVQGNETLTTTHPFPVTLTPAELAS